jgi:serine/threonine protein kinase
MIIADQYEYDPQKDRLGKGGFGSVFKAYDQIGKREVALKFVPQSKMPERYSLAEETQRLKAIQHPNLVKYYDFLTKKFENIAGEQDLMQIGVMEYINGGDLGAYMKMPLAREKETIKSLLAGILKGLGFLHQHKIIHRDIKPQNILLEIKEGKIIPKIADFSLSKQLSTEMTSVSATVGTYEYMSPEQLGKGNYKLGVSTDIWSFGILMYQLFSQELPFGSRRKGDSDGQIVANIINDAVQPDLTKIPDEFKHIVKGCLQKNPTQRLQTTEQVMALLFPNAQKENISLPLYAESSDFFNLLDKNEKASEEEVDLTTQIPSPTPELETRLSEKSPLDLQKTVEEGVVSLSETRMDQNIHSSSFIDSFKKSEEKHDKKPKRTSDSQASRFAILIMIVLGLVFWAWANGYFSPSDKPMRAENNSNQVDSLQKNIDSTAQEVENLQTENTGTAQVSQPQRNKYKPTNSESTRPEKSSSENTESTPPIISDKDKPIVVNPPKNEETTDNSTRPQVIRYDYEEEGSIGKIVSKGGLYGFLDKKGNIIIPLQYSDFSYPQEGLAAVKKGNKWGFINLQNQVMIPFKYDQPGNFKNGRAEVTVGGKDFYIDKSGKCIENCN